MSDFEITVKVNYKINDLIHFLNKNHFKFHQSFRCIDIFLIKEEDLKNKLDYSDLNKCIILLFYLNFSIILICFNKKTGCLVA